MEQREETAIITRILEGETNLYSYFLDRYSRPIHTLIVRIVQSREDAEELTQDVFLKAFKKLDSFKGDCSFSTWLYQIAYHTAISATRKQKRESLTLDDYTLNTITDEEVDRTLDKANDEEIIQRLEQVVTRDLNGEERALISLFYNEEKSVGELAAIFNLTAVNVKVKLHRIRKKIYVLMKKEEEENNGK